MAEAKMFLSFYLKSFVPIYLQFTAINQNTKSFDTDTKKKAKFVKKDRFCYW